MPTIDKVARVCLNLCVPAQHAGMVMKAIAEQGARVLKSSFSEHAAYTLEVDAERAKALYQRLMESTRGSDEIVEGNR